MTLEDPLDLEDPLEQWAAQPRSVSQITEFETCPYKGFLKRVRQVQPRPAAWIAQGLAFHTAVEGFEKSGRTNTTTQTVESFQETYSTLINQDLERVNDIGLWLRVNRGSPADDLENRYHAGTEQTRRYVHYAQVEQPRLWCPDGETPAVEMAFQANFGGVVVRGIIDQVLQTPDGSLRVRDLKTGSTKSRFQLWVYGLALRQLHPDQHITTGDWYLAKEHRVSRPVPIDDADIDEITGRVVAMDQRVKAGAFPAQPGRHCFFCEVSHECEYSSR